MTSLSSYRHEPQSDKEHCCITTKTPLQRFLIQLVFTPTMQDHSAIRLLAVETTLSLKVTYYVIYYSWRYDTRAALNDSQFKIYLIYFIPTPAAASQFIFCLKQAISFPSPPSLYDTFLLNQLPLTNKRFQQRMSGALCGKVMLEISPLTDTVHS